jgi:hypothetical protein
MKMNVIQTYKDSLLDKYLQDGETLEVSPERAAVLEEAGVAYRAGPEVARADKPAEIKPNVGPAEKK